MADRVTQVAVEVLQQGGNPNARVTQAAREVLQRGGNPNALVTQIVREVLVKNATTVQPIMFVVT